MATKKDSKVIKVDFTSKLAEVDTLPDRMFCVESESQVGIMYVIMYYTATNAFICTCPGWQYRNDCKHIALADKVINGK